MATSFEQALSLAFPGEVYVIGGGQIYQLALAHADRAVVTEIELEVTGDTYFPELTTTCWEEVAENRYRDWETDRKSTRLNSSHSAKSRMPSSA